MKKTPLYVQKRQTGKVTTQKNHQKQNKGKDMTQFYDKIPFIHRKIQKEAWQHKIPPKIRLNNDICQT